MEPFTHILSVAAPLPQAGIDTDIIFPARFLLITAKRGLGRYAFYEWRFDSERRERPEFVLNREPYRHAEILVCGDNFGAGSSREQAVWALRDLGVRCVISTRFAEIFHANCFASGVLPITVDAPLLDRLLDDASGGETLRVDLEANLITRQNGESHPFAIAAWRREALLHGWDEIDGLARKAAPALDAFEAAHFAANPWLSPQET